ncbi:MAG TPA: tetratricopeptide repeat protein [Armatimonadota bacterium]|nr:tetratricopeptide repeat protein [Armatimonadota bacterium]
MKPDADHAAGATPKSLHDGWGSLTGECNAPFASLAAAFKAEGRFEEARAAFEKAIELEPDRLDYYCGLAMVQRELNSSREAADTLRHALAMDPGHDPARQMLAEVYLEMGIYTGVIEEARTLLARSPRNAPALAILAAACQETGDMGVAIASVEQLVRLCPRDAHNHYVLGSLYRQRGDLGRALERFERTVELAPDSQLADLAQSEIQSMDSMQIQLILLLAAENPGFRVRLEQDPVQAAYDYGFRVSDNALAVIHGLDFDQIPQRPSHWGQATYH